LVVSVEINHQNQPGSVFEAEFSNIESRNFAVKNLSGF